MILITNSAKNPFAQANHGLVYNAVLSIQKDSWIRPVHALDSTRSSRHCRI